MDTHGVGDRIVRAGLLPGLLDSAVDGTSARGPMTRRTLRDVLVDGACVLLAIGMGVIGFLLPAGGSATSAQTLPNIVAGIVGCLALLVRRRFAVTLAAALIVASIWLPLVSGASLIALFTAAVHRRLPIVLALVVLAAASAVAQISVGQEAVGAGFWPLVGGTILLTLLVVGWGVAVRGRREVMLMMAERLRRLQAEQEALLQRARQDLRDAIARDMHDSLAHRLSLISMSAGALQYRRSVPPDDLRDMVAIVRSNAQLALGELRQVVTELREADGGRGNRPALGIGVRDLVDQARAAGQRVDLRWDVSEGVPPRLCESAVRVVQEGLSNARKHAPGAPVTLVGSQDPDGVSIDVTNRCDTAPGGSVSTVQGGLGLQGMTERVGRLGGQVTVAREGDCFHLHVRWQLPANGGDR